MFSQFRHAVESFAPPVLPRRESQDASDQRPSRSNSPASSDPAIANLRKSLAAQRSGSPSSASAQRSNSVPGQQEPRVYKSNLEERLRAKFAIGEASGSSTPAASGRTSPAPAPTGGSAQHPLSPSSTPLPDSPAGTPAPPADAAPATDEPPAESSLAPSTLEAPLIIHSPQARSPVVHTISIPDEPEEEDERHPEADIPLPPQTPANPPPKPVAPEPTTVTPDAPEKPSVLPDTPLDTVSPEPTTVAPDAPEKPSLLPATPVTPTVDGDVDALQQRLKLVEQRFTDVSKSFKRLQAEKVAADTVLRELTPLETIQDADSLRDYLQNAAMKAEISQDEIVRLTGKLTRQDERIEELRDTHRLESASRSEQFEKLRRQHEETEAQLQTSRGLLAQSDGAAAQQAAEIARLQADGDRFKALAKEEEEKRVKAISLLKSVRQKLVKAEKERDEAVKEAGALREREQGERERERAERAKLQKEIEAVNGERERALAGLRAQFDREVANVRERFEKELSATRGQYEMEAVTTKAAHTKELSSKNAQVSALENSVTTLSREKNAIFDQLQLRQAELESSQSHLDSLQTQNTELQYQLRETSERLALLHEEIADARREHEHDAQPRTSPEDVARLLSAAEAKYEARIAELRRDLGKVERERTESEAEWSRKLKEKAREMDELRRAAESSVKTQENREGALAGLREEIERLQNEVRLQRKREVELQAQSDKVQDVEDTFKLQLQEVSGKVAALEHQIEEYKGREAHLRLSNKTLREELRKVQSSAALLEKQRNPGVGYWTARPEGNSANSSQEGRASMSSSRSGLASPRPGSPATPTQNDEEVNLEYLRNVILQFLEHKEMRPNLVRVLSIILHFTPQETRRLVAKV
ncbi:hypothetical protein PLICRDRAFT_35393 [Plicaturopsis crispa FD-325 SS-3]|nr:hypothetical protein PLICRDRAFT_35393 [Plicaturopsis crispa FD-325 SS-3]